MSFTKKIKIAFVHDDFIQNGGAEKLFLEIVEDFKLDENYEIEVFSSLISKEWKGIFAKNNIAFKESILAKIPFSYKIHKVFTFFNLFHFAFLNFDFSEYDVVFSSSTRFGHFIITKPQTYHISYINSPFRALWEERDYFFGKKILYLFVKNFLSSLRISDFYYQNLSDLIISNSKNIQNKVLKIYKRSSIILYPFLNSKDLFRNNKPKEDYYLVVSRLVSWKRIDYVIETFNTLNKKLIVVGNGPDIKRYKKIALENIEFKGFISEKEKDDLFLNAKALILPQNEDFGLVILEALSKSCPIVYFNSGGAKEILNTDLGVPFVKQDPSSLEDALNKLISFSFDEDTLSKTLTKYSKENFVIFLKKLIQIRFNKVNNLV